MILLCTCALHNNLFEGIIESARHDQHLTLCDVDTDEFLLVIEKISMIIQNFTR